MTWYLWALAAVAAAHVWVGSGVLGKAWVDTKTMHQDDRNVLNALCFVLGPLFVIPAAMYGLVLWWGAAYAGWVGKAIAKKPKLPKAKVVK